MYEPKNMKPTVQVLTTSGTYICPATCKYIQVYIVGGGGGGGGGSNTMAGGGGGPGKVLLAYFPAADYVYVIGSAGTGGAINSDGTAGTTTTFNGKSAAGGSFGNNPFTVPALAASSSSTTVAGTARLGMIAAQAGMVGDTSGNGGTNMFGLNGKGFQSTTLSQNGAVGTLFGGGGSGGLGATGTGGAGVKGGCIVIEHY